MRLSEGNIIEGKTMVIDDSEVKGLLALHCQLAKMDGYTLDKKCMRYNAMWDYIRVCGGFSWPAFWEALETAIEGNGMYTGAPFDIGPYRWMLSDDV